MASAPALTPAVRQEAEEVFNSRCAVCHGPRGGGDGAASAGLTPPPRNFQDKAWQAAVSDEHIEKIIAYGGGAVGRSPAMPPNPDLADKPVVRGLREHIRGLAAK
ncbi:c-type cytochrome [Pyxidicoccus sp. MSG2]|uniref:c-type cytochrome n=1 Tax=Pyxidicoccus sp. MSG2 TaxID=2996790 RepID=UPI00226F878C|nr:c-type cytochrome [Pyxidicoccus sp. MSG2]MCY1016532.1 c-type cytochrome [Pyxidicoccus sp. MSG2]